MKSEYNAQRKRNIFFPLDTEPFELSRTKIENFKKCPRCFYLDRKCGTGQPSMFPYTLNKAVDALLKNEFDQYRAEKKAHPYIIENNIDAIPYSHKDLNTWRTSGIKYEHEATNFTVTGIVDDVWI